MHLFRHALPVMLAMAVLSLTPSVMAQLHIDAAPYKPVGENRIEVGKMDLNASPQVVLLERVFAEALTGSDTSGYGASSPGFLNNSSFPLKASADLNFRLLSDPTLDRNLGWYDGTGPIAFDAPPAGVRLYVSRASGPGTFQNAAADGTDANVAGYRIERTNASGVIHKHLSYFLRGNGQGAPGVAPLPPFNAATAPPTGLYVISLQLTMTGLTDSPPIWFVFNRGLSNALWSDGFDDAKTNLANERLARQWTGSVNNTWDTATTNWTNGFTITSTFKHAVDAQFRDNASSGSQTIAINLPAPITAGTASFLNVTDHYTLSGAALATAGLLKQGTGNLTLHTPLAWTSHAASSIAGGVTRLDINTGATSLADNASFTIQTGTVVQIAGAVDPFTDLNHTPLNLADDRHVDLINHSAALSFTQGDKAVGRLDGTGDTTIAPGASLRATRLRQRSLTLEGAAPVPVPEPASAAVLLVAAGLLLQRRR